MQSANCHQKQVLYKVKGPAGSCKLQPLLSTVSFDPFSMAPRGKAAGDGPLIPTITKNG